MDELACFAPGMLALGASGYGPDEEKKFLTLAEEVHLDLESQKMYLDLLLKFLLSAYYYFSPSTLLQLAWTCYNFYQSTPTKLAGENYYFSAGQVSV